MNIFPAICPLNTVEILGIKGVGCSSYCKPSTSYSFSGEMKSCSASHTDVSKRRKEWPTQGGCAGLGVRGGCPPAPPREAEPPPRLGRRVPALPRERERAPPAAKPGLGARNVKIPRTFFFRFSAPRHLPAPAPPQARVPGPVPCSHSRRNTAQPLGYAARALCG